MPEMPEALKFRIMMCLLISGPSSCSVTEISRTLNEKKYTITRSMNRMEQEGLVDRSNVRCPVLTQKGRTQAERYRERVRLAQNHLLYEGVDVEHARQDACSWAMFCSDALMNVLRANDEPHRIKEELRERHTFSGSVFCKNMKDGGYTFPFIIYREHMEADTPISCVNEGFEHPCTLHVEKGEGVIQLRMLPIRQGSGIDKEERCDCIQYVEYLDSGRFISAEIDGTIVSIPMQALSFVNMGTGADRLFHGSVGLRLRCSCSDGQAYETKATFTILI